MDLPLRLINRASNLSGLFPVIHDDDSLRLLQLRQFCLGISNHFPEEVSSRLYGGSKPVVGLPLCKIVLKRNVPEFFSAIPPGQLTIMTGKPDLPEVRDRFVLYASQRAHVFPFCFPGVLRGAARASD
jgi:hypothetical protein